MIGELAVSFCDRKDGDVGMCIDIWTYPDSTCNIVVSFRTGSVLEEFVFPSAPHQLEQILEGKPLLISVGDRSIKIEAADGWVCAECQISSTAATVRQCVYDDVYRRAIEHLVAGSLGYLA